MRPWAIVSALLTGVLAVGFFLYAPTPAHFAAGVFIGVPAATLIYFLFNLPGSLDSDRRLLFVQAIATVAAVAAELTQHLPLEKRILGVTLLSVPLAIAANRVRQDSARPPRPNQVSGNEQIPRAS